MDYISREDAINAIKVAYWDKDIQAAKDDPCIVDAMTDWAIRQVKALPAADVAERKRGEWIHDYHYGLALPEHKCSICGEWEYSDKESNYCPNCGADMREDDNGKL